jgi:hypothetical protein
LTQFVILLDAVVVLSFVVYIITIKRLVRKEVDFYDLETVSIEDFAIQVKGIPPKSVYKHKTNLRAMLTAHFEKIVANQPSVTAALSKKEQFKVSHIVAIDFARKDFSDYEVLQQIQDLIYKGIKHRYREIHAKKES